ncbi:hypothetical protein ACO0QE_002371 [Hanseniaspora vineae]
MFQSINNFDSNKFWTKSVGNPYKSFPVIILVIHSKTKFTDILNHLDLETDSLLDHFDMSMILNILDKVLTSFIKHLSSVSDHEDASLEDDFEKEVQKRPHTKDAFINLILQSKVKRARVDFKEIEGIISKRSSFHSVEKNASVTKRLSYNINKPILALTGSSLPLKKIRFSTPSAAPALFNDIQDLHLKKSDISNAFVIKQIACRSAIMFGQSLSMQDCELMLSKLSQCHMPFHCAHGRPSITPLVDLAGTFGDPTLQNKSFEEDYKL